MQLIYFYDSVKFEKSTFLYKINRHNIEFYYQSLQFLHDIYNYYLDYFYDHKLLYQLSNNKRIQYKNKFYFIYFILIRLKLI